MKSKILVFLLLSYHLSNSQGPIAVELNRTIYPSLGQHGELKKYLYDTLHILSSAGKDSLLRRIDEYSLVGGDFVDGKVRFTVIVNNSHGRYIAFLAPYKSDSAEMMGFASAEIKNGSFIVAKAMGKEYSATINKEGTIVTLQQLFGRYSKCDVQLYDSLMPDGKFDLFNGGTSSFEAYKHQHKYIYVVFWYGWQPGDTREIDALKNVSDLYKDALTVLSFHSPRADTAVIRQIQKDKNIDWVEAKDGFDAETDFPSGGHVLFNDEGKAVALSVWPQTLKAVIEKLLHVGN